MKKLYVLLFFCALFIGKDAMAQTIRYVKSGGNGNGSSWASASGDLQAMINAAATGDEVWVAAGTYYPTELLNATLVDGTTPASNRDKTFIMRTGVKIYGGFSGVETTLAARNYISNVTTLSGDLGALGDRSDNAYHIIGSKNAAAGGLLDGFTLQDGYANGTGSVNGGSLAIPQNTGAAIATRGTTTNVTYSNLIIKDNEATSTGGAVYLYTSGTITFPFINVQFINNKSGGTGGAVFGYRSSGTPIISFTDCKFSGNQSGTSGGAIYLATATTTTLAISNSTFENNIANNGSGGAIYFTTGTLTLAGSKFAGNKSVGSAGAIYLGTATVTATIDNVMFEANEATTSGGAIYFYSNSAYVTSSKFVGNKAGTAGTGGGAIFLFGLSTALSAPTFVNTLFYDNQAAGTAGGGAVYGSSNIAPTFINSTFYGNKATVGNAGAIYLGYSTSVFNIYNCLLYGNTAVASAADIYNAGTNNLSLRYTFTQTFGTDGVDGNKVGLDPLFENTDYSNSEFLQLQDISPAVDAGEVTLVPALITKDLAGNARINNSIVDMGAFEYSGASAVAPLIVSLDENTPNGTYVAQPVSTLPGILSNWNIEAGNVSNVFAIDPATGRITVANSTILDYETRKIITLRISVKNATDDQSMYVIVNINNLMEDPLAPVVANVVNGVLTSFRPKLSGIAEPLSSITIFVDGKEYPTTTSSDASGKWVFNFVEDLPAGVHSFYVVANHTTLGTSNPGPSTAVILKLYSGLLKPNNILTPNGDGKNDVWKVENLTIMYPNNEVIVYDKVGKVVYRSKNYQSNWDGTYNGQILPTGSYYYELNIGAGLDRIKGTITIIKGR